MDIVLIGGLWLDSSAWDRVTARLREAGHRPIPVALPGQGDGNEAATLADQVAAVVEAVDGAESPVVVGHSAACGLAWLAADVRADKVAKAVMIGGFPCADGERYADFFPVDGGVMAFPGWGPFEGADSADLSDATKQAMQRDAIPVPEGVARGVVELSDDRRYDVPAVLVCPEFTPADVKEWIDNGDIPELAKASDVSYVDLDTGHWPMFSAPDDLARALADIADHAQPDR